MKFDIAIGNPPYQEEVLGTSDNPIYHLFLSQAYKLVNKACFITPARFLFNAGKTPKVWNQEMLSDPHLKVTFYEADSTAVFPNSISLPGGVAVTYRDSEQDFGAIKQFVPITLLRDILHKVNVTGMSSISPLVFAPESYKLSEALHADHPQVEALLSKGHKYDVTTNIYDKLGFLFLDEKPNDGFDYIQMLGREANTRVFKWIRRNYIRKHPNLDSYKVAIPKSNGSPSVGEADNTPVIGDPILLRPGIGHNQTFISIGAFSSDYEAESALKYVKTKFARAMLGTLKVTQDNKKATWNNVPLQDFTMGSDIDWSQTISSIDQQLYKKYGLNSEEITFIEAEIRPME